MTFRCQRCGALSPLHPVMVNGWLLDAVCAEDARRGIAAMQARSDADR